MAAMIRRETGIHMPPQKRTLMQSRLARRLRVHGLADFSGYRRLVEQDESEMAHMVSCLTTNVTRFFRENQHFDELRTVVLPDLIERARQGGRVRLWSAGCSTGEEPCSMALTLLDLCPDAHRLDIRILASDLDPQVVQKAARGIYSPDRASQIPEGLRGRFFSAGTSDTRDLTVAEPVRALISFRVLNLLHRWPFSGPFDVIFCRNVVIYFEQSTQTELWPRFAEVLASGGRLFIGHSERLSPSAMTFFEPTGITSYKKIASSQATVSRVR
ncbi:MAG: protein-glutamate O-methyltransferase CheR [Rhodobacteraceae bacterium]|nr:protein-glutamate O-methyltransferase CheR [Paracoccaceae bacterium]